tara:strand:+ start:94 stop:495 length:402 start_codon:yes stop_codon:yes gene_type:complete
MSKHPLGFKPKTKAQKEYDHAHFMHMVAHMGQAAQDFCSHLDDCGTDCPDLWEAFFTKMSETTDESEQFYLTSFIGLANELQRFAGKAHEAQSQMRETHVFSHWIKEINGKTVQLSDAETGCATHISKYRDTI